MFSSYRQELNFRLLCFFSLSSFVSWAQINIVFVVPLVVVCFFGILIALNYIILKQYWPTEISCSSQHSTTICEQNSVDCAGTVSELPTQNAVTLFSSLMFSGFHYHSLSLTMSWYFSYVMFSLLWEVQDCGKWIQCLYVNAYNKHLFCYNCNLMAHWKWREILQVKK